jgi:ferredoxin-thioredoxin reductase catalytic subunit/glutaredoxin
MDEIMTLKLYVNSTCPLCNILKKVLEYNNIKFELINIDNSEENFPSIEFSDNFKNIAFPIVAVDNEIILGYDKEKLERLLNKKLIEPPIEKLFKNTPLDENKELINYYDSIKLFSEYSGYYLNPDKNYVLMVLDSQIKNQKNGIKYCPCKLGNVICPCPDRDEEIKTYGHCFCGLYVSKSYMEEWKPEKTLLMLSNRNIKNYKNIPETINSHFLKIHVFFNRHLTDKDFEKNFKKNFENSPVAVDGFLDKSYRLKNSGYGFKDSILVKFKEDEAHKNFQLWYNDFNEYFDSKNKGLDIKSDYEFDIAINTQIGIPNGREFEFDNISIITNYKNPQYRRRYLIKNGKLNSNLDSKHIINVVDNIIYLEVIENINKIMKNAYVNYAEEIESLQKDINQIICEINVNNESSFEEYLSMLSNSVKNISNLQERITKKYNLFEYYMTKRLGDENFKSFLESINYGVNNIKYANKHGGVNNFKYKYILKDYNHLLNELNILKNTVNELIEILETNVNISQNNKAIKLQNEIHNTAKTQLNMHRAVEGLYTIFAAFYFTELALIIFEGLNHSGIVKYNAYVLASLFVPFALLLGILVSKKLKKSKID